MNGGQIIVDYLIQEKVPYLFGLCGHGNISLIDANIGADMNPAGAGVWELPGLSHKEPALGGRHIVQEAEILVPIPIPGQGQRP
jgi:hypothetical protein